jgi:hypothetical protein
MIASPSIDSSQNHVCFESEEKQLPAVLQIHILAANKVPNSSKNTLFPYFNTTNDPSKEANKPLIDN